MLLPKGLFLLFPAVVARAGFLTWSPPSKLIDFLFRLLASLLEAGPDTACNTIGFVKTQGRISKIIVYLIILRSPRDDDFALVRGRGVEQIFDDRTNVFG